MREELEQILGRRVDLVSRRAIESSSNWVRRQEILENAQLYYTPG
jgi:predicted nucleotidyltransferase